MRLALFSISILAFTGCSLITVPVKTAGSVVKTTVSTAGHVVEAPFKAVNGGYRNDKTERKEYAEDRSRDIEED